jgi:hypothetical protein
MPVVTSVSVHRVLRLGIRCREYEHDAPASEFEAKNIHLLALLACSGKPALSNSTA